MKVLIPVLILIALALSFGVAGAEPPGPKAGWLHLHCEDGLSGDVWFGSQHSQAFHLADGPILSPRAGWYCSTQASCDAGEWIPAFSLPGKAKGVETIVCYADVNGPWAKRLKIEVAVAPPD
jgi:hypothetical protein